MKIWRQVAVVALALASTLVPVPAEASPLYSFSSHTFTSCGMSGRNGPTLAQCKNAYIGAAWSTNSSYLNVSAGIESWTAPSTGLYQITAAGAPGVGAGVVRGLGAIIQATVTLNKGAVYRILVGQAGSNSPGATLGGSGGGGGGTFFTDASNNPIVVAGGGGGATENINQANRINGQTTTSGSTNSNASSAGGTAGGAGASNVYAAGGAGLTGDSTQPSDAASYNYNGRALSFINGGTGGTSAWYSVGGFGGGGGTHGSTGGGGGGGGYSGGAGSPNSTGIANAGGGGSYVIAGATGIATSNGSYAGSSTGITNLNEYNGVYASATIPHGYLRIVNLNSVSVQVSSVSGGNTASYRTSFQVRATLSEAGGKVTFYQQGKVIPNCKSISTGTTTATCSWSPSFKGAILITASVIPNSDTMGSTSPPVTFLVGRRTTLR